MRLNLRRILMLTLLGVVMYGVFVFYAGYRQVEDSLASFRWWTLGAALGLSSANYGLRFLKWQYYLRVLKIEGVRTSDSLLIFLSGFVLTVTPGKVGEVFKSVVLSETHGVTAEKSAPIVIAERLTDVIGVVVLILAGSASFDGGLLWATLGGLAVGAGLTAIFWSAPTLWILQRMEKMWLAGAVPRLREAYARLQLLASPRALLIPACLSICGWALEGLALFLLLYGFSAHVGLVESVFFYATATLAGALIPVPGGLGVTEALIQQQLVRVASVGLAAATSSMLLIRLTTLWWAVLVGFFALGLLKIRFPCLLKAKQLLEPNQQTPDAAS